jgi:hypothetical protein
VKWTVAEFRLIDLASQADEAARYVAGWPKEKVLRWFQQQGEVTRIVTPYDNALYSFRSRAGVQTGFRFTETGQLVIIGEHSTYRP